MNTKSLFRILSVAIFATAALFAVIGVSPVLAESTLPEVNQSICTQYAEDHGNVAKWEDPQWQACFIAGYVNAVFSTKYPLPTELPVSIQEALDKGLFLQLTEPWKGGCDNTLKHPSCSIGFLKLFGQYETLRAFLQKGEFTQAEVLKSGPWSDGSLWMTSDFVQVSEDEVMTTSDAELFCTGSLGLAFAFDGEYPLPAENPCSGRTSNKFFLRERWNGGCVGNILPNAACNVGEVLVFDSWDEVLKASEGEGWLRGSVFANHRKLMAMAGIEVATATPLPPTVTPTVSASATKVTPPTKSSLILPGSQLPKQGQAPVWLWIGFASLAIIIILMVVFRKPILSYVNSLFSEASEDGPEKPAVQPRDSRGRFTSK